MAHEDTNVIDQPEMVKPRLVTIEISGKKYEVPEGITVIKALWYTGQEVVRGAGCLGGFCGACATYYRTKDDPKVRTCLACQMAVQDGMSFTLMPPFPARKALYDIHSLKDPKQDLFNLYPEAPLCRNCNACTEACPQKIDVREGVWKAVFGDFKGVSEMFMDCVMCGMCNPVCIADIAPNLVALYVSRTQGAHFTESPSGLDVRIDEIQDGRFNDEWKRILTMNEQELTAHCAGVK
ncbi:MAG: (2Fe-2S)-binding protein [Nitrospiraceae bacterium]|nr:(2Fe-2S)-binding protein [Nitrospiraceae bacterium]